MKISIVFEPNAEWGPDPLDPHGKVRAMGEFYDTDNQPIDVLLVVREYGEKPGDQPLTHFYMTGAWESHGDVMMEQVMEVLDQL